MVWNQGTESAAECNNQPQPSEIIIMHNNFKLIELDSNVINYTIIIIIIYIIIRYLVPFRVSLSM